MVIRVVEDTWAPMWAKTHKNMAFHHFPDGLHSTSLCGLVELGDTPYAVSRRPTGYRLHVGCRSCLKLSKGIAHNAKHISDDMIS